MRQETIDALGDDLVSAITEKKESAEADIVEDRTRFQIRSTFFTGSTFDPTLTG